MGHLVLQPANDNCQPTPPSLQDICRLVAARVGLTPEQVQASLTGNNLSTTSTEHEND